MRGRFSWFLIFLLPGWDPRKPSVERWKAWTLTLINFPPTPASALCEASQKEIALWVIVKSKVSKCDSALKATNVRQYYLEWGTAWYFYRTQVLPGVRSMGPGVFPSQMLCRFNCSIFWHQARDWIISRINWRFRSYGIQDRNMECGIHIYMTNLGLVEMGETWWGITTTAAGYDDQDTLWAQVYWNIGTLVR